MSDTKEHNCHKCTNGRATIVDLTSNIRRVCRELERGVPPTKAAKYKEQIAGYKERIRDQKRFMQEHLDEVLYSPAAAS